MRCFVLLASFLAVPDLVAASDRHCLGPGDINADHVVDLSDHSFLANCMAGPDAEPGFGCLPEHNDSADLDLDGDVDLHDAATFGQKFNNEYFDYGPYREDKEAERLAIELTGAIRAPGTEYDRIVSDLLKIREAYPELLTAIDSKRYVGDRLIVRLVSFQDRNQFDDLNSYYVAKEHPFINDPPLRLATFCDVVDAEQLEIQYENLSQVLHAEPDYVGCTSCCGAEIQVERVNGFFQYRFSYVHEPDHNCFGCLRTRTLQSDKEGSITALSCTDSCLPECP